MQAQILAFRGDPKIDVLGLDIGGANIKAATSEGRCLTIPFAIWKAPELLLSKLSEIREYFPETTTVALTMTAELADCFLLKSVGVAVIVQATEKAFFPSPVRVWLTTGQFCDPDRTAGHPELVAASNWHALATFSGRYIEGESGLLIDIGTTTTDLIPLTKRGPETIGSTDTTRLMSGELVYTGSRRTPLCAIAQAVPFRGTTCPLAAEWFSTSYDLALLGEDLPEDPADLETANGRPATVAEAHARIARQICGDVSEVTLMEAREMAQHLSGVQVRQIQRALEKVLGRGLRCHSVLLAGSGEFLARRVLQNFEPLRSCPLLALGSILGPAIAEAACAFAVATLLAESS